jgi:peroxin-13
MYNSYGSNTYPSYGQSMPPYGQQYGHQFGQQYGQQFGQYQTQPLGQGTQQAFFVLEQLVQTISGFSQMLESTFHATQSSFMAMLGLASQFHQLRSFMMDTFSLRSIMDPIKRILGSQVMDDSEKIRASGKKPSKLPLVLFLAFAFGFPWFISRLLRLLEQRPQVGKPLTELQFAQALYDYNGNSPNELSLRKGDIVAILDRYLESWNPTKETAWWQGRLQNGTVGIFPSNYVKLLNIETKSTNALEDEKTKKIDQE